MKSVRRRIKPAVKAAGGSPYDLDDIGKAMARKRRVGYDRLPPDIPSPYHSGASAVMKAVGFLDWYWGRKG